MTLATRFHALLDAWNAATWAALSEPKNEALRFAEQRARDEYHHAVKQAAQPRSTK